MCYGQNSVVYVLIMLTPQKLQIDSIYYEFVSGDGHKLRYVN